MKRFTVKVEVALRPGHSDPEGDTTADTLRDLGYKVDQVAVSKVYRLSLTASSPTGAKQAVDEMARRLLANPTKDTYSIEIEEIQ